MNYNQNNKRKMMEDEMNRFENEINGPTNYQARQSTQISTKPQIPAMFIPHQLQRQNMIPNQLQRPPIMTNLHLPPNAQTPFLPTNVSHLVRPSIPPNITQSSLNQSAPNGFKPIIQPPFMPQPNIHTGSQPLSNTIPATNVKPSYTVTPMALPTNVHNVSNPVQPSTTNKKQKTSDASKNSNSKKQKKIVRTAGGTTWEDPTLLEWDNDDFRIFCGDLGNDVNEDILTRAFNKYPSFIKCKVVRDKRTNKSKGYGFISFKEPSDFIKAMRDMDGKYVGSRPIKLRRSNWKDRNVEVVKKKMKEKQKLGLI